MESEGRMNSTDRALGMDRAISRRDFLSGVSIAIGTSLIPGTVSAQEIGAQDLPGYYPPGLTGMRGSHPGSGDPSGSGSISIASSVKVGLAYRKTATEKAVNHGFSRNPLRGCKAPVRGF